MARVSLNVIKFTEYNQAIYPFDYYVECESTTPGKLSVLESGADAADEINYNNDALIGKDGKPLFATYTAGKYVLKVLGFFKQPDATSKEFEFKMNDLNEKYVLVAKNNALVKEYYVECESTVEGAIEVVATAAEGKIAYNAATLVDAYGDALYTTAPTGKYVLKVSGTKTLTIKKGNSIQGVEDKVYKLRHGGTYYIVLESGRYKNVYGNDKGKVIIEVTDTLVEMAALCLE
jgi:hypothetical protein